MANDSYDVVVIGAGPAGFAAAMFAARRGLRTVIVSKDLGGQLAFTDWIENYPGVDRATGRELCERFLAQARRDGAAFRFAEAVSISPLPGGRGSAGGWVVRTAEGDDTITRTIILSFGLTPNDLGCAGEVQLKGKGLYYSAVSDAPRQDGKTVAVVGGGNSAVTAAIEFAPRANKVYLIHRRKEFRAEKTLLDRLHQLSNVETLTPYMVAELKGEDHVEGLVVYKTAVSDRNADLQGGAKSNDSVFPSRREEEGEGVGRAIPIDSILVRIGYSAKTKWLEGVVELNAKREVVIDRDCATSAPGIFAAGDLTDIAYKQAAISVGEGVKAALQAFQYLQAAAGKPAVMFDWDVKRK